MDKSPALNATIKIASIGIMSALAAGLMFLEFPIFPAVNFLKYDPSEILPLLGGFIFGLKEAILILAIKDILFYFLKSGDIVGILMNFAAGFAYIVPILLIYNFRKNRVFEIIGYIVGVIVTVGVMAVLNLLVVPFYWKVEMNAVVGLLPWIMGFNAIKFGVSSVITGLIRKRIEKIFE